MGRTFFRKKTKDRVLQVDVLEKEDGDWGYHSLDEAEHPYHYDCPMSLLRVAGKTTDPAAAVWREQVRKHHAQRRALLSSLETGRTLLFGDKKYRLHSPAGPKRGWYAVLCEDGNLYRLSVDQLSRASFA